MVLQGALTRLMSQGSQADLSLPPCYVGDRSRGEHLARLMRCPEAARLNWTAQDQTGKPVCEIAGLSVTEKAPEQSGKADARVAPRKRFDTPRMGSRCWCGGGREALVWP